MRLWGDNAPSCSIRLGTVLVTNLATQNLVSIIFTSSTASRDASLLPLTRLNWRPHRRASTSACGSQGQRAKCALTAASRQTHTCSALCVQQGLRQSASKSICQSGLPLNQLPPLLINRGPQVLTIIAQEHLIVGGARWDHGEAVFVFGDAAVKDHGAVVVDHVLDGCVQ